MDVTKEITKEIFEQYVPAAKMPERNTSVFNRMVPYFSRSYQHLQDLLFKDIPTLMDADDLKNAILQFVCIHAFFRAIPSLDLVLTGTGFGVVSTNDTAPASQTRVKALRDEMEWQSLMSISALLAALVKTDKWGDSVAGKNAIRCLYYDPCQINEYGPIDRNLSMAENWRRVCQYRATAEQMVRREISQEYYDALLCRLRTGKMTNADIGIYQSALDYISRSIGDMEAGKPCMAPAQWELRDYMERYAELLPEYKQSKLYSSIHGDRYENQPEDPTFFFVN